LGPKECQPPGEEAVSHPRLLYNLLFQRASETLLEVAADPKTGAAPRRAGALDSGLASAARERHRLGNTAAEPAQREISRNTRGYARTHAKFRARARNSRERAALRQNRRRFPDFTAVPGNLAADFPQPPPFTKN
jgi:hypothetical protein